MKNKKRLILILVIGCVLMHIFPYVHEHIQKKQKANYEYDLMRFEIKLKPGEYRVADVKSLGVLGRKWDTLFNEKSKIVTLPNDIDIKYSKYIVTKDKTYIVSTINSIDSEIKYIECNIPISDNALNNLRNFIKEKNCDKIIVIPFNDGIYSVIRIYEAVEPDNLVKEKIYIFNIETKELLLNKEHRVSYKTFDIKSDRLVLWPKDHASKWRLYEFDKYGEFIKNTNLNNTIARDIVTVLELALIIVAIVIGQILIYKKAEDFSTKIVTTIITIFAIIVISYIIMMIVALGILL